MQRIAVIGSGFGGLATAAMLAKDGYSVTLFEKTSKLVVVLAFMKKRDLLLTWDLLGT